MVYSSCIYDYRVVLQVLGSQHFHLLAFHVIQGNQVIVRGEKRKTVESVLNCLKVSCIAFSDSFRSFDGQSVCSFGRSFGRSCFLLAFVVLLLNNVSRF